MSRTHEAIVGARFDALQSRFRPTVEPGDYRLAAVRRALGPLEGLRILDLGCGKGRFARRLADEGADVIGLDLSQSMLAEAGHLPRVRGSALRLPFGADSFDALVAVEVFQHLPPRGVHAALAEARRVVRPGGRLAIVDRNALAADARRPWLPGVVVKRIDEWRGLWMYRPDDPVRERWFRPDAMRKALGRAFEGVTASFLLSPSESSRRLFRRLPWLRSMTLWTARVPGGGR